MKPNFDLAFNGNRENNPENQKFYSLSIDPKAGILFRNESSRGPLKSNEFFKRDRGEGIFLKMNVPHERAHDGGPKRAHGGGYQFSR